MKRIFLYFALLMSSGILAQDSTNSIKEPAYPVRIFNGQRAINANTTEMVGKGKMEFFVTHFFDDFDGPGGIATRFLGLDNARDVRIAFHIGLSDKLDFNIARIKGAAQIIRLYEFALKYQLTEQRESGSGHKWAIALFANTAICSSPAKPGTVDVPREDDFSGFSDRLYKSVQLIIARRMGKVSLQFNPTLSSTGHVIPHDQKTIFAMGGVLRFPVFKKFNLILDYFHPFRSQASKDYFGDTATSHSKLFFKFYDPLGIGFEIVTEGHVFHLNFTNNTEILESRFIHRTISKWGKGQFRWGFTISRQFNFKKGKK